jgi:hypothetical protein
MRIRKLTLCAMAAIIPAPLFGWGADGHRIIAAIASRHLSGKARAAIQQLLEPGETLVSIATWADEVRGQREETAPWHYINIPASETNGDWARFCPKEGCVAGAVLAMKDKLRNRDLDRKDRAEALKFFVHFLSDMHQPLHAGNPADRGGNNIEVVFFDRPTNLHSLWDSGILRTLFERDPSRRQRIEKPLGFMERRRLSRGDVDEWLWEAHDLAQESCYAEVPKQQPAQLGEAYYKKAVPVVETQIRRAGARLARELNEVLGK